MSKAEMTVHDIKPDSLRFERQDLRTDLQFVVVDMVCNSDKGDEFRLKMFMDRTRHDQVVTVNLAGFKVTEDQQASVIRALRGYLEHLEKVRDDALGHGRNEEGRSCAERALEVRRLIGDEIIERGVDDDGT